MPRRMRLDRHGEIAGFLKWSIEMSTTRREFIINLGISIASLALTRCASYQDSSSMSTERSSTNLPADNKRDNVIMASKPARTTPQEPTETITKRPNIQGTPDQAAKHPMTPAEWLECDPCNDPTLPADGRLRRCWENLYLLEKHLYDSNWAGMSPREMLIDCHISTLKDLVIMGELSHEGAREMHEAFLAAIQYVLTNAA